MDLRPTLGVLESTKTVSGNSKSVQINRSRVTEIADSWMHQSFRVPEWNERYHYNDGTENTANYILVLDSLNFCFWGHPTWRIEYKGEIFSGYWALAAALKRAIEENILIFQADFLANIDEDQLKYIFRGQGEIPLFQQRLENMRQVGRVLKERYDERFVNLITKAGSSAVRLAEELVNNFPSFNDVVTFRGQEVRFYKRAQICVADLYGTFGGTGWGYFNDLDRLTAFADYRVPSVLRRLGALEYSLELSEKIKSRVELSPGSDEEVEIRASTIWAVEYLRQELASLGKQVYSLEIDWYLWEMGGHGVHGEYVHHLTKTIYY